MLSRASWSKFCKSSSSSLYGSERNRNLPQSRRKLERARVHPSDIAPWIVLAESTIATSGVMNRMLPRSLSGLGLTLPSGSVSISKHDGRCNG